MYNIFNLLKYFLIYIIYLILNFEYVIKSKHPFIINQKYKFNLAIKDFTLMKTQILLLFTVIGCSFHI